MAERSATARRIDWAARQLLACRSTSACVAELAEMEAISLRSARRYVARAHQRLVDDLEESGVDRRQLVAQVTHGLMEAMAKALASGHASAVVGCSRELRKLLNLSVAAPPVDRSSRFPRFN